MSTLRNAIRESFREEGVRCTSQRYAILEHLMTNTAHPTAEEIHRAINRRDPRASLATVYKALHAMAKAGLIRELNLGGGSVRFESARARHHHFVCESCGRAEDVGWFEVPHDAVSNALGRRTLRYCEVLIRGRCEQCQAS